MNAEEMLNAVSSDEDEDDEEVNKMVAEQMASKYRYLPQP